MASEDLGRNEQHEEELRSLERAVQGDVVGRDKVVMGDVVYGDKVIGDKISITQRITQFILGDTGQQRALRNRQNMLQLVWNTWIEGVLKKSLHNEVLIELGMETKPDAVEHPWDMVMQMPNKEPQQAAQGTTMLELFDQANGSLLILGEPGSGKTTMLLELARLAIKRAEQNPMQPIPVIFNLSSWTPKQTIAEWLVEELKGKYYVSKNIGGPWVEHDELLLLLDGLDEVNIEHREGCVKAINDFRTEQGVSLAVCSRTQEYEVLTANLRMRAAVLIQPLTDSQLNEYLLDMGTELAGVQQVLNSDPEFSTFIRTPLILSILIMAYRNTLSLEFTALETRSDYRKIIFDDYIEQMFRHRGAERRFTLGETKRWLVWLAQMMIKHGQTMFYVENIQPSWLYTKDSKQSIRNFKLLAVIIGGIIAGLIGWITGMLSGVLIGEVLSGVLRGWIFGFIGAWVGGLIVWGGAGSLNIRPTERLRWSWKSVRRWLIIGLFGGLLVGLIGYINGGLISGLTFGLLFGLIGVLMGGFQGYYVETRGRPGDGIKSSLRNALIFGLLSTLLAVVISGLIVGMVEALNALRQQLTVNSAMSVGVFFGLNVGPYYGLLYGWIIGLIFGLINGGGFAICHLLLRRQLFLAKSIPRGYINFLEFASERIFLRRVGGGYIFIHRMLMEHFAEMDMVRIKEMVESNG